MPQRTPDSGFSLIELMIALLILAILTVIAVPTYQSYVTQTTRTKAQRALLDIAGREEQYFSSNNTYTSSLANLGLSDPDVVDKATDSRYYTVSVASASTSNYTLTASPGGAQTSDSQCGSLSLNRSGQQTSQYSGSHCW